MSDAPVVLFYSTDEGTKTFRVDKNVFDKDIRDLVMTAIKDKNNHDKRRELDDLLLGVDDILEEWTEKLSHVHSSSRHYRQIKSIVKRLQETQERHEDFCKRWADQDKVNWLESQHWPLSSELFYVQAPDGTAPARPEDLLYLRLH
jgi:hypothetical protein